MPKRGRSSVSQYRHYKLKKLRKLNKSSENGGQLQYAEWSGDATAMPINDKYMDQSPGDVSPIVVASSVIAENECLSGPFTSHFSSSAVMYNEHRLSLAKKAKAKADARAAETIIQRERRLRKDAAAKAAARASEDKIQRHIRLERDAAFKAIARRNKRKGEIQHLGVQHLQNQILKSEQSYDSWQMESALSSQKISNGVQLTTEMPVLQDSSLAQALQTITKPDEVLASPFQIIQPKSKLVINPNQTTVSESIIGKKDLPKRKMLVTSHLHSVMSNLASMWRMRKFCDASISNGSSTVMVHKIVLSAVSPKLFSLFGTYTSSQSYEVQFPEVSTETLMAFVEYIYTGLLDLDLNILQQLKVIAKQLDIKDLQNQCDAHLLRTARQQPASTVTAFDDPKQMPSPVPDVPTEDIKQETSQNEELKEDTPKIFEQQAEAASLSTKDSVSLPTVKLEIVGPDDDKYGQMNKRVDTSSSVSDSSHTLNTTLNSIAVSTTDYSIPFSDTTSNKVTANKIHGTSPKLKSNVFESSLVSDLPSASYSEEKVSSESQLISENPSKPLNQTIMTYSIDDNVTSGSNEDVYPVGLFTAGGDRLPLSSTQVTNVKHTGLYKTDDPT